MAFGNYGYSGLTATWYIDNVRLYSVSGYVAGTLKFFVDEFGDGNYSGSGGPTWTVTDNGGDGDTQWSVENGMLKQINYGSAAAEEHDHILYDLGSEIAGAVFEFDVRIGTSDSWDVSIGMGGDAWKIGSHLYALTSMIR